MAGRSAFSPFMLFMVERKKKEKGLKLKGKTSDAA